MKQKQLLNILNDKSVTVESLLFQIKKTIENFQNEREDFYIDEFREMVEKHKKPITDKDINRKSQEIFELVQSDTMEFVMHFADDTTDFVLDCINENKAPLEAAHTLLTILSITKDVFKEQIG